MPIVLVADAPSREMYDQVQSRVRVKDDPPDGLILHTASEVDGAIRIVDVWESMDAAQAFERERLFPAMGNEPDGEGSRPEILEPFDFVRVQ